MPPRCAIVTEQNTVYNIFNANSVQSDVISLSGREGFDRPVSQTQVEFHCDVVQKASTNKVTKPPSSSCSGSSSRRPFGVFRDKCEDNGLAHWVLGTGMVYNMCTLQFRGAGFVNGDG